MCIILSVPPKKVINPRWLVNAANNHVDGWGYMYADKGRLYVHKDTNCENVNDILAAIAYERESNPESHFFIHFRAASYGDVSIQNTHPITINEDVCIVHNGSFAIDKQDKRKSDTAELAEALSKFTTEELRSKQVQFLLETLCREAQGFVGMMFSDGSFKIFNEDNGIEEKGIWFSNNTYKKLFNIIRFRPEKHYWTNDYDCSRCVSCGNELNLKKENKFCEVCSSKLIHTFSSGSKRKESETSTR